MVEIHQFHRPQWRIVFWRTHFHRTMVKKASFSLLVPIGAVPTSGFWNKATNSFWHTRYVVKSVQISAVLSVQSSTVLSVQSSAVLSVQSSTVLSVQISAVLSVQSSTVLSVQSSAVLSVQSSTVLSVQSSAVLSVQSSAVLVVQISAVLSVQISTNRFTEKSQMFRHATADAVKTSGCTMQPFTQLV